MIDAFAGIGGFRYSFEKYGVKTVFSFDKNHFSQKTYLANFGDPYTYLGDIRKFDLSLIPPADIVAAGFPCQPYSKGNANYRQLGKSFGLNNKDNGDVFYCLSEIIHQSNCRTFLLENVPNILEKRHDKDLDIILSELNRWGYVVKYKTINANLLVPQSRERVFFVGFRGDLGIDYQFPEINPIETKLLDILETDPPEYTTLWDKTWDWLQKHADKQKALGKGYRYSLANIYGHSRTLSARYNKDGSEILIPQTGKNPRKLSPREAARLMGYPDTFKLPCSPKQTYIQLGNSVVPLVIDRLAESMVSYLQGEKQ